MVTSDVPLGARCIARRARVPGHTGRPFTEANIGDALATRNLLSELRGAGLETASGPAPFDPRDLSRFLQERDRMIHASRREGGVPAPGAESGETP